MGSMYKKIADLYAAAIEEHGLRPILPGAVRLKVTTEDTDRWESELDPRELPDTGSIRTITECAHKHPITWDADKTEVVLRH